MSGLVYPANLPGLTWGSTRTPVFNTGIQQALSSKESAIAYQQYPIMEWELQYELLRDYTTPSDIKALVGLFMAVGGKYDSFLYTDPEFNTVANMQFATPDGVSTTFQTTATYANAGGPGGAELIQNFNGLPVYYINRYGALYEIMSGANRTQFLLQSQTFSNAAWAKSNVTVATSATAAPDATATASNLVDNTSSLVQHQISQAVTVPAAVATFSFSGFIYNAGATEAGYLTIAMQESTGSLFCQLFINLSTGVISNISGSANWSNVSGLYVSLGNGWFRFSIIATKNSAATTVTVFCIPTNSNSGNSYAGTNGSIAAIVWGLQLENYAAVISGINYPTMYLPTTTGAITQADFTLGTTGIITTTNALAASGGGAPAGGASLQWSGSFFYRVRFDDDSMTSTQFMKKFWENKRVKLRQRKL